MKKILLIIAVAAGAFAAGRLSVNTQPARTSVRVLTRLDTVVVREPVERVVVRLRTDTVRLAVADPEAASADSAVVQIPVSQAIYSGEGYMAWVSGYRPRLDSIAFTSRETIKEITLPQQKRSPRFSAGLQAGIGLTPKGFQPYIGVGIAVRLWEF